MLDPIPQTQTRTLQGRQLARYMKGVPPLLDAKGDVGWTVPVRYEIRCWEAGNL